MNATRRRPLWTLCLLAALGAGCSGDLAPSTTSVLPTPPDVLAPEGPGETGTASESTKTVSAETKTTTEVESTRETDTPQGEVLLTAIDPSKAKPAPSEATSSASDDVVLKTISIGEFKDRIAKNEEGVKYSVVDGWATYCPPCMENFPHLVEMNEKYADQGLRVISVSFDDTSSPDDVAKAAEFLKSKHATFENYIFSDGLDETYELFNVNAIPAVFVFGPDGKEIKRFTLDDPDNQFTYDEVEAYLKGLLSNGKTAESEEK